MLLRQGLATTLPSGYFGLGFPEEAPVKQLQIGGRSCSEHSDVLWSAILPTTMFCVMLFE